MIDWIIFFLQLVIAGGFLYFAYIYDKREKISCWANVYSTEPLEESGDIVE